MSDWYPGGWYRPAPKKPPPKHGIRMKKSGSTWWGQRWVEALERMSTGYANRLARGRTYARAGRTHDLIVQAGKVSARVTGSGATPYKVRITLSKLRDAVWDRAIVAMAGQARFSAELLAGQMPQEIDAAFKEAGASIFPVKEADLVTDCDCPDWANPCKHVAAAHYVLGEALDRDPFLLFELRGRTREQVLAALRSSRAGAEDSRQTSPKGKRRKAAPGDEVPTAPGDKVPMASRDEVPTVSLGRLRAADYDRPREPLPLLHLSFEPPPVPGSVLRQLGTPAGWSSDASPVAMLGPLIRAAADRARSLAMAEPTPEGESHPSGSAVEGDQPGARPKRTKVRATAKAAKAGGRPTKKAARTRASTSGRAKTKSTPGEQAAGTGAKKAASSKAGLTKAPRTTGTGTSSAHSTSKSRTAKAKPAPAATPSPARRSNRSSRKKP